MVIQITPLGPHGLVGPALDLNLASNFIGPIQTGSAFVVQPFNVGAPEILVGTMRVPTSSQIRTFPLFSVADGTVTDLLRNAALNDGDQTNVVVDLVDPANNVLDHGTQVATWSNTAGQARQWFQGQATGGGGLTQEQDQRLIDIQGAVNAALRTATGLALETPIGSVIAHPARQLFNFHSGPGRLTGRGSLTPEAIPGIGTIAYGLMLSSAIVPAGFGLRDGQIQEYFERIAQFVVMFRTQLSGVSYPAQVFDYRFTSFCWVWADPFPSQILYDITPDCAVDAFWVVA